MFTNILWAANLSKSEPLWWDSIRLIIESQRSLAQSQSDLAMYGITLLIAIALLLATASWLTNVYIIRHARKREREEDFEKLSEKISKTTKEEIEKMQNKIREGVDEKMISFDADKARLFALSAQNAQLWDVAAAWWAIAIKGFKRANQDELVRISVNHVLRNLTQCKMLKDNERNDIKKCLSFIPIILRDEREQIKEKLDKLPKELPEGVR